MSQFSALFDDLEASITLFATYNLHCNENSGMTVSAYNFFLVQRSHKQISLLDVLSNHIVKFATYYSYFKKKFGIIESTYNLFILQQPMKLILLLDVSYDYIFKIIKLLCYEPQAGKNLFIIYFPYQKKKLWIIKAAYDLGLRYNSDI